MSPAGPDPGIMHLANPESARRALGRAVLPALAAVLVGLVILADAGGLAHQRLAPASPAARGLVLWRRHNCVACHSVYGLGGHLGPDLTNVTRRRSDAYLRFVLVHGLGGMPRFALGERDSADLLAWLRHLDGLGAWPPTADDAPVFGRSS